MYLDEAPEKHKSTYSKDDIEENQKWEYGSIPVQTTGVELYDTNVHNMMLCLGQIKRLIQTSTD